MGEGERKVRLMLDDSGVLGNIKYGYLTYYRTVRKAIREKKDLDLETAIREIDERKHFKVFDLEIREKIKSLVFEELKPEG